MDLSIVVATYNHEKYIEKAIGSILQQKISFSYEVWIGDDASSDGTQKILKKMKTSLPDNFHIILRDKNLGAEANFEDLYIRTTGKYLAVLEGDDYWLNPFKLERQIEFLEKHPDYFAIAHNVEVVDENGRKRNGYNYPECKHSEYTLIDFQNGLFCGQTASIVSKNYYLDSSIKVFRPSVPWAGDRSRNFLLASYGRVYCVQEAWSAYRYVNSGGFSYSANFKKNPTTEKNMVQYYKELYQHALCCVKTKDSISVSESIYFQIYLAAIIKRKYNGLSLWQFIREFAKAKYKFKSLQFLFSKI